MTYIQIPPDGAGKKLETNTPDGTDHRQVVSVGDPTSTNVAAVNASGAISVSPSGPGAGATGTTTQRVVQATAGTINTGQINVGSTATLIIAANATRVKLTIFNIDGTTFYLGNSGVTTSTGSIVPAIVGYPVVIRSSAAVYGIVASGTNHVSYIEEAQ